MADIRELKFSIRTRNLLLNAGIKTVEQLLAADLEEIRKEHMFGPVTMAEIDKKVREYTQGKQVGEENDYLYGLLYSALKEDKDLKVERFSKGISVVFPSGRRALVRIEG